MRLKIEIGMIVHAGAEWFCPYDPRPAESAAQKTINKADLINRALFRKTRQEPRQGRKKSEAWQ